MDQEFRDFRPVPLIGWHRKIELYCAYDPLFPAGYKDATCPIAHLP